MKRLLISLFVAFGIIFGMQESIASADYSKVTSNAKIIKAMAALEGIGRRDVLAILNGRNATRRPIRVMFRDFAMFGYENCEAITVKTRAGGLVIYINQEHKSASPECIACLIAHEAQHHTFTNSKAEELRAWISETQAWNEFLKRNKQLALSNEPLAKRENYIARLKTKKGIGGIEKIIASNPVYAGLN